MALIVQNADAAELRGQLRDWAYNALDCCVTREVFDVIDPRLDAVTRQLYEFEMATQSPAMAMMRRGVLVNDTARLHALGVLDTDFAASEVRVNHLLPAGKWTRMALVTGMCPKGGRHAWPKGVVDEERYCKKCGTWRMQPAPLNPLSPDQLNELFYENFAYPPLYNKLGNISTDAETLERLARHHPEIAAIVAEIDNARSINKQHGVMSTALSVDGRMRCSYNVGAPETGRWSSSSNAYGEGTNKQNITEKLRYIFVADPGMEMFYADLEQAESKCVAYLADDQAYIDAHNFGDVHTYAARLIWPDLPWNGDLKKDKKIASELHPKWDPDHSYRDLSKRVQHGSNYGMTPYGIARLAHIPTSAAEEAQENYFGGFPGIPIWQKRTIKELQDTHTLTTPLGRRRRFFGRHWDKHVQRQAIAQVPQSMVADILNLAMHRVWSEMDLDVGLPPHPSQPNDVWLLDQVHDAILGEVRAGDTDSVERVLELMQIPVPVGERVMTIGVDVKRGKNWGKRTDDNPEGMK